MGEKSKKRCFPFIHPFKQKIRELGIPSYRLKAFTGISESELSRYLNGIDPMPYHLEKRLIRVIDLLKEHDSELSAKEDLHA